MRPNRVKQLWREGKTVLVGWMATADPYATETLAHAGFDALVLDMQHGMGIGPDRAAAWLQIVSSTDTTPMVRVSWNDPVPIQYVLDAGAYGVIVPLINNREEAEKAAGASRYAPLGYRSVGPNRARLYAGADYEQYANEEIICLVMIEHINTIPLLDDIAATPGIDGFYVGPADLAMTMGLPAGMRQGDERHGAACLAVVEAARKAGLVAGIHCSSPAEAEERFQQGFVFAPIASDARLLATGAKNALDHFREVKSVGGIY